MFRRLPEHSLLHWERRIRRPEAWRFVRTVGSAWFAYPAYLCALSGRLGDPIYRGGRFTLWIVAAVALSRIVIPSGVFVLDWVARNPTSWLSVIVKALGIVRLTWLADLIGGGVAVSELVLLCALLCLVRTAGGRRPRFAAVASLLGPPFLGVTLLRVLIPAIVTFETAAEPSVVLAVCEATHLVTCVGLAACVWLALGTVWRMALAPRVGATLALAAVAWLYEPLVERTLMALVLID